VVGNYEYFTEVYGNTATALISSLYTVCRVYNTGKFLSDEYFALLQRILYCNEVQFLVGLKVGDVPRDSGLDVDGRPHVGENDGALYVGNI